MKHGEQWLSWASELQSLAQAGLYYGRDKFDLERYARIREIAAEMVARQADLPLEQVRGWFCNETGYQTPKLATRAAVFQGDRILLVKEPKGWALPGGWVDVDVSVRENVIKEVREEAGLEVRADRVIALQDGENHHETVYPWKVCIVFALVHPPGRGVPGEPGDQRERLVLPKRAARAGPGEDHPGAAPDVL